MSDATSPEADAAALGRALRAAAVSLAAAGIGDATGEARRLAAVATGLSPLVIATEPDQHLAPDVLAALADAVRRRAARVPLARIAGVREFFGREFRLSSATLEPRADTETLIEAALELAAAEGWTRRPMRILDVGTGSGCILLTLLAELPLATGLATDVSGEALVIARDNAVRLGVADRARFALARSLTGISGTFDLVASNPPYIASAEIAGLEPEVRDHDPLAALDGGADGLDVYRDIAADVRRVCPAGWALFEVGAGQHAAVLDILRRSCAADLAAAGLGRDGAALPPTRTWLDLGGHTRIVAMRTH